MGDMIDAIFAWDWTVAYRSALVHVKRDRLRYRVYREQDDRSPTGYRWTWQPQKPAENPCPRCGSETEDQGDCPTYKQAGRGWMRCAPACGDARTWWCTRKGCDWMFAAGYAWDNPNHQRLLAERGEVPEWLGDRA